MSNSQPTKLHPKALIVDLEAKPADESGAARIFMVGALRADTGLELEQKVNKANPLDRTLEQLDGMAAGASFLLGHNMLRHDWPLLKQVKPSMQLLELPVIDTLSLSPLAFPQNPYHRLIKDYKLIRDSLNSPLSDCHSTLALFQDQRDAFSKLGYNDKNELLIYQSLLAPTSSPGLGAFFSTLTGQQPLPLDQVAELIPALLKETDPTHVRDLKVCRTRLQQLLIDEIHKPDLHWPIAYALAWLRVSGGNSVLPPWVFHQYPQTERLLHELRDLPCSKSDCQYCLTTHDPRRELQRYFGFDDFRHDDDGKSLQHDIVLAGMRGEHVLAVLATGGGKSLCYQLPALNRYYRNGSLTIIISPLQSLMKDQVDGLLEKSISCAAALNGMLTMPERADVLEKIQMGDVGILLVSPEQFRNKAFGRAINQRRVGAWIFDEAHCLSKWGHDFRPDYLYAARFIREFTGKNSLPPIGCFTATAKPDVLNDIQTHFREVLGFEFKTFFGSHERDNLSFDVLPCQKQEKRGRILELLQAHLTDQDGGAVVFVASRTSCEEIAAFIAEQKWACWHFHAGLAPNEKKDIQDGFKSGKLRIIVATNAFGMGVDKPDIRLVIHADIPGSLENYLQEAGRAGRDQQHARCVLLYDPEDIETQFRLSENSKLSFRDIQQIFKKLRKESSRRAGEPLIITAGEILQDDAVDTSFESEDRDSETKVVTAVSWLERGDYLTREENVTRLFPARLTLPEGSARKRLVEAKLPQRKYKEFESILGYLRSAGPDERVSTDQLMQLTGQTQEEVIATLQQLEQLGLLVNDARITVFIRHGIEDSSRKRLTQTLTIEQALFGLLSEQAPDAENGEWQDLCLSELTSALKTKTDLPQLFPPQVLQLLKSLTRDRAPLSNQRSSFDMRVVSHDYLKLRVLNGMSWRQLTGLGEKRRALAGQLMTFLVGKLPSAGRGSDLLAETTFSELQSVIESDLELASRIAPTERRRAVEHVLLFLHQQQIVTLNHGMTVMRRAMTIDVNQQKSRYLKDDFRKLDEHYRERIIQVHVMREYANKALAEMADALRLVLDYFNSSKADFLARHFANKEGVLKRATSEESWRAIVDPLSKSQREAVVDDYDHNRLILAGPGSGKTRVIVHRVAYLLRVRRVPAAAIVVLAFNRHATNEIRKRLHLLVGNDAFGVTILTYHSLAMRLTGTRFQRNETVDEQRLDGILSQAVDMLGGGSHAQSGNDFDDELRQRLLRGYRYILVDEYQDIDELQYKLVCALAGRQQEEEQKLCILAVGDDDQNIYAFRQTSNKYIEHFREDYQASIHYLIENYRSTRTIIAAANRVIAQNPSRLKQEHPIKINESRGKDPAGGRWQPLDADGRGEVVRLLVTDKHIQQSISQAQAAMSRLEKFKTAGEFEWCDSAILARSHKYLLPIQAYCEQNAIPYHLASEKDKAASLTRYREYIQLVDLLRVNQGPIGAEQLQQFIESLALSDGWYRMLTEAAQQFSLELGSAQLNSRALTDWLYDYFREVRQEANTGLFLGTVHSAKGLEFAHVVLLDGNWGLDATVIEEERRLFYVGMTRAEHTLTLCEFSRGNPFSASLGSYTKSLNWDGEFLPQLQKRYCVLSLTEIDIGFAGRQVERDAIHKHIADVKPGSPLRWEHQHDGRYQLLDERGNVVGRTSKSFELNGTIESSEVAAVVVRYADDSEESFRAQCKVERWEVVIPRVVLSDR
jgi:ATP-dependent DNA helicase RecQ